MPRSLATSSGVLSFFNPSIVANTTFCLLFEPRDFARIFLNPAISRTLRAGPPAITPVPSGERFNNTSALLYLPLISCGTLLLSSSGTLMRFLAAASFPFLIASGISDALPSPTPTCPFLSPTTTKAVNLKLRPP